MSENNNPPQDPKVSQVDPKDKGFQAEPVSAVHAGKHAQSKQTKDEAARKANDYTPEGEAVVRQDIDNPNLHFGTHQDVMPEYYTAETEGGYSGNGGVAASLNQAGNGDASSAPRSNGLQNGAGFTGANGAGATGANEELDPNRSVLDDVEANSGLQGGNGPDAGGPLNNGLKTAANVADSSGNGPSEPQNLASISDVTDSNIETNAVDENASAGTVVGVTALATDADVTDTVTYSLSDDAGGLFTIDPNTGVVTTTGPLDAETATSHVIEVTATSTDGSTSTGNFTIAVNDLNESAISAITDTDGTTNEVSEGASIGTAVGVTAFASDADVTDTVTYSLSNNPGGLFAIDANTGVITVAGALDAETALSHTIEVTATSTDGSTSTADFTIAVTDVNEAAIGAVSDNDGTTNAVDENASAGTVVGVTALATDADVTDTVTYSLSDDAGGLFTIDPNTGVVTTTGPLDAETATSHVIEVTATSTDGSTSTGNFTIAVNDLNESAISAITDTDGTTNEVSEGASIGTAVGVTAFASDADVTDTVTYSLSNNPGGLFAIDANTGVITVAGALDAETALSHTIEVTATSTDGSTSTADFTIAVTDVDEADITAITDTDGTANAVLENASVGTSVGITAFATDADVTDTVSYSLSNDAGGLFTIDSNTGEVTVNGDLTSLNGVDPTIQVTATSTDGSTSTADFTIDLNAAPTDIITNQENLLVNGSFEQSEVTSGSGWNWFSSINGWQTDSTIELQEEGIGHNTSRVATDGDQWFEMDADTAVDNIYQDIQTVAGQNYQLSMDVAQRIDSSGTDTVEIYWNGTLVDTVDPSSTNWETFSFNVEGTGGMDRLEFREPSGDNDATGSLIDNVELQATLLEDAANGTVAATVTSVVDPDAGDTHTFSLTDDAGGAFTIDTNTGVITVADNSLLDFETAQTMNVTVQATDQDGLSYSEVVTINIGDVSEAGISSVSDNDGTANAVDENAASGTVVGVTALATDPDVVDTVTYSLSDDAGGLFQIDANTGVVTTTGPLDAETATSHTIEVTATSTDGSTSVQDFTVNVNDLNEAAISAVTDSDTAVNEVSEWAANGATVGLTGFATDTDVTDSVTYSLVDINGDPVVGGPFQIDGNTGEVTVADRNQIDYESDQTLTVYIKATSSDGSESTESFDINVLDRNEGSVTSISDTDAATNAVNENAGSGTVVGITAYASDHDGSDTVSYSLSDDAGGLFQIDANTGVVTTTGPLDAETATSHTIEVTATSTDGSTSTANFTIGVNDLSETTISAITDTDGSTNEVSEGASIGTAVGVTAFATDADVTDTVTYSLSNNPGGLFAIDANTGVVTVAGALDAETATSHTIEVTATSTDGSTSSADFTIAVTDVDEANVGAISDTDAATNGVNDTASIGTSVGITAFATDADVTDTVSYSLSNDAGGLFTIDSNTGEVTVAGDLTSLNGVDPTIEIKATSSDGSTSTADYTIDLNSAPTDIVTNQSNLIVNGNFEADSVSGNWDHFSSITGWNTTSGPIEVHDGSYLGQAGTDGDYVLEVDSNGDTNNVYQDVSTTAGQNYQLSMDMAARSNGNGSNTIEVYWNGTLVDSVNPDSTNWESYTFNVEGTGGMDRLEFRELSGESDHYGAFIDNVQLQPALLEDAANGTVAATVTSVVDPDSGDTHTFSLTDDAGGAFAIDTNTGVITVADNALLDFEAAQTMNVTVQATDQDGLSYSEVVTINVGNSNEAPTDLTFTGNANFDTSNVTSALTLNDDGAQGEYASASNFNGFYDNDFTFEITFATTDVGHEQALASYATSGEQNEFLLVAKTNGTIQVMLGGHSMELGSGLNLMDGNQHTVSVVFDELFEDLYLYVDGNLEGTAYNIPIIGSAASGGTLMFGQEQDSVGGGFDNNQNFHGEIYEARLWGDERTSTEISNNWDQPLADPGSESGLDSTWNFTTGSTDDLVGSNNLTLSAGAEISGGPNTVVANTVVADVTSVIDSDSGDTHTFALTDDASGKFAIDANTGEITLVADHDASTAYQDTVTVQVTDSDGNTYQEVVGIHIGTNDDDTITGTANTDVIYGLDGESTINGGDGDDFITVGTQTTTVSGTMTSSTTYTAINLGNYADVDTNESNGVTDNISDLLGTYGSAGSPLHAQTETAVANDTDGNGTLDDNDYGHTAETITFDGVEKAIDSTQVFNATVTFTDGSSGTFTAVVSQFEGGDVYLMPEYLTGADADLLTSKPIMSVSLDSVSVDHTDLVASRLDMDYTIEGGTNTVDGGAGNDVIYGSSGNDVIDGGADNDTIHGSPHTLIAHETFEGGASGWSNNQTDSSTYHSQFLGRHGTTGHSDQDTSKTFTLDAAKTGAVIEFDFYRLDGWENDGFKIFIDGQEISFENNFYQNNITEVRTDTAQIGDTSFTTTYTPVDTTANNAFGSQADQTFRVRIEIENPADGDIELGFGSTLSGAASDESYGIDNLIVVSTDDLTVDPDVVAAEVGDTLRGGSGNDTIYGSAGDDTIQGDGGDDTVYAGAGNDTFDDAQTNNGNDTVDMGTGNDIAWTGDGDDTLIGGEGNDMLRGEDGSDLFIFREGDGTDDVRGGVGGGWTDTIELQAADGSDVDAGWTYNITSGSVTNSGADFLELSDDASGSITLNDGSQVNFHEIERIEW